VLGSRWRDRRPASSISSATSSYCRYAMTWTPATPGISLTCWMISVQMRLPSRRCWPFGALFNLDMISSGMLTPGTLARIYSAVFADRSGPTPTRMKTRLSRPMSLTWDMKERSLGRSKQNWVWTKPAPASTFFASRIGLKS